MQTKVILITAIVMATLTTACTGVAKHNTLTQQEIADGWELLFDGETLNGWRDYNGESLTAPWFAEEG